MTLKELNNQIETKTNEIFEQVFPTLKVKLSKEGLSDETIREFSVFERIKEDIEFHLVQNTLSIKYDKNADQLEFWDSEIQDIILFVELKYSYLYEEESMFFARKSITGIPMNSGWVANDCTYLATESELLEYLRLIELDDKSDEGFLTDDQLREKYYENGTFFYTEWYDPTDITYALLDNKLYPINYF